MNIIIGDCVQVMSSMKPRSIDLIITDPPYGISYKSNRQGISRKENVILNNNRIVRDSFFGGIENDNNIHTEWLTEAYRVLKDNSAIYIFCHWSKWSKLQIAVEKVNFTVKNMIVMNKSNHGMGDLKGQYAPKHELLLFASKGRHILNFANGRDKDIWNVPVKFSGSIRRHPNEKPKSWVLRAIINSSHTGDIVLDPFAGSGSFVEAANESDRIGIGIEIVPRQGE